jgi:hypothetical protein
MPAPNTTATVAGVLLIVLPLAFNAAFALLAARFDYPDILRRPTREVLGRFRDGGTPLILLWWSFGLTAVLLAPLAVLLSRAIPDADGTLLAVGATIGVLAALARTSSPPTLSYRAGHARNFARLDGSSPTGGERRRVRSSWRSADSRRDGFPPLGGDNRSRSHRMRGSR